MTNETFCDCFAVIACAEPSRGIKQWPPRFFTGLWINDMNAVRTFGWPIMLYLEGAEQMF